MIRNVVMGRLRDTDDADQRAADNAQLDAGLAGIKSLDLIGMVANHVGRDEQLRDGGWTFAITNDWVDIDAYHRYDRDPTHIAHRATIAEVCGQVARVQFEL